jgi:hypothetical protein
MWTRTECCGFQRQLTWPKVGIRINVCDGIQAQKIRENVRTDSKLRNEFRSLCSLHYLRMLH